MIKLVMFSTVIVHGKKNSNHLCGTEHKKYLSSLEQVKSFEKWPTNAVFVLMAAKKQLWSATVRQHFNLTLIFEIFNNRNIDFFLCL